MKRWPYCKDCGWHSGKCPARPWYATPLHKLRLLPQVMGVRRTSAVRNGGSSPETPSHGQLEPPT